MTKDDLVSVIIPCFNAGKTVATAIESALGQTHERTEVIVLDDGSTDASLDVIRRFAGSPRFAFESGPNRGGNAARNRLLRMARGEWIQLLDADDQLLPTKVEKCLAALRPGVDMAFCDYIEFSGRSQRRVEYGGLQATEDPLPYVVRHNLSISSPLHRRQHLLAAGGFDESLRCCQEYELHIRLARNCWKSLAHVPEALYRVVRTPGSVSADECKVFVQATKILGDLLDSLRDSHQQTPERARAIALALEGIGRSLARRGRDSAAKEAFRLAVIADPDAHLQVSLANRALTRVAGPASAEAAIRLLRQLLRIRSC